MELVQNSNPHIKQQITSREKRRREETLDEARRNAEKEIARREQQAHSDGTNILEQQKTSADKASKHYYNRKRQQLHDELTTKRRKLREDLEQAAWTQLRSQLTKDAVDKYLKRQVKQAVKHNEDQPETYDITCQGSLDERTAVAKGTVKKYEASLADLVETITDNHWNQILPIC